MHQTAFKIKVSFVLPSLVSGGAERVMSYLAQNLNHDRFDVVLIISGHEKDSRYEVPGVRIIYLEKTRVLWSIPLLLKTLRQENPDIVFSALRHMNVVAGFLSLFLPSVKFIAREANVMTVLKDFPQSNHRSYPKTLLRLSYRFLDIIVCQSLDMEQDLKSEFPEIKEKIVVINNPITDRFLRKENRPSSKNGFKFITVGSLEPRKGHKRILEALKDVKIPFLYTIIGDGAEKESVEQYIRSFGLTDKVRHIPYTAEVDRYLKESHIFLQGSYVEGFPNALLESCSVGTPVIAFNAPGGIDEIIVPGINGFIANDISEFIMAIETIVKSEEFTPASVRDSVTKKYGSPIILSKYESLFCEVLEDNSSMAKN